MTSDWKAYREAYNQVIKSINAAHQKHYNYVAISLIILIPIIKRGLTVSVILKVNVNVIVAIATVDNEFESDTKN